MPGGVREAVPVRFLVGLTIGLSTTLGVLSLLVGLFVLGGVDELYGLRLVATPFIVGGLALLFVGALPALRFRRR